MARISPKRQFALIPMVWISVGFTLGIATAKNFGFPVGMAVLFFLTFTILSVVFRIQKCATYLVIAASFSLGIACSQFEQADISPTRLRTIYDAGQILSGDPLEIEGKLSGPPEPLPEGYFLLIKTEKAVVGGIERAANGRVRIFVSLPSDEAKNDFSRLRLSHGTRVRVACLLEREERYQNPGVYSRKLLLDRQGIDATANLKSPLLIEKIADAGTADYVIGSLFDIRIGLIQKFRDMFSRQTAGVLIASMLGNKYFLDKQTADVFRDGGTFHVLVISGLHITFIGGALLLFVRMFTRRRWTHSLITITLLWFYGIAVGGDVPVVRACLMFTIVMIGYAEFKISNLLNSVGATVLFLLAWRPSDLFDSSFQLTFVSVAAIVALGLPLLSKLKSIGAWMPASEQPFPPNVPNWLRRFCETVYWNEAAWIIHRDRQIWTGEITKTPWLVRLGELGLRRAFIFVFESIVISAAVQICLLPLLVYYFHRFPLVSIPMNIWVGGALGAESIAAVTAVAVSTFSDTAALPFAAIAEIFNWLIVTVPSAVASSVYSNIRFPIYSGVFRAIYLIYAIPLIVSAIFLFRWDPFALKANVVSGSIRIFSVVAPFTSAFIAAIILLHPYSAPLPDGKLRIDFLDVGQGDAGLVTFPSGGTMVIDAGGKPDYRANDDEIDFEPDVPRIGEMVVSEFLWERGISHIDSIVATHADADHIQGLSDVVRNFSVNKAYLGRMDDEPELAQLLADLERFGVDGELVHAGESIEIDGVRIEVLNPISDDVTPNNGSVVLKFTFGETSFLFTGDIEAQAEALMLQSGDDLHADVVKVPHHGSRSSSTEAFVNAVHPRFAVISVGKRSVFGHPHREVVGRWRASGAEVMTTGERGTITVVSDGKGISVSRFVAE